MNIISYNVNGIRAAINKGFVDWLKRESPDVICLQEIKANQEQVEISQIENLGYNTFWFSAQKKGYSGVAIYSKHKPSEIISTFSKSIFEEEGRFISLEFGKYIIASIYFPSGSSGEERQKMKYEFMDLFEKYVKKEMKKRKMLILCGDYNIAHTKDDIKNWRSNQKNSGFLPEERAWMTKLIDQIGLVDAFRVKCKQNDIYTWWSNRGNAYNNNVGWRIDYQMVTSSLLDKINKVYVYKGKKFSDHAPLVIDYDI